MTNQERVKELLTKEFIPDLKEFIDDIFITISQTKNENELKQELEDSQELLQSFQDIVKDIDSNNLEDEECKEILEELEDIKKEYETQK